MIRSVPNRYARDLSIDSLRGVAIVLMVGGHVIGWNSDVGMKVPDDSAWRTGYLLLADMRMPLFTALSGFVYGLRPIRSFSSYPSFVRGKGRRLLVPLLTVGTAFILLQSAVPGTNSSTELSEAWRLYVFGLGHFWFLQAIFLILLLVGILDALNLLRSAARLSSGIATAAVISLLVAIPSSWDIFSVSAALTLLPFFLLGYGFARFPGSFSAPRWWCACVAAVFLGMRALEVFGLLAFDPGTEAVLSLLLGLSSISALIAFRNRLSWTPLARLGYFSFAIYLLHVFGTAPTRMILQTFGVESELVVFFACLAVGLGAPVLFEITFGRVGWISWSILGQKPFRSRKAASTSSSSSQSSPSEPRNV